MGPVRYSIIIIGRQASDCTPALRALTSLTDVDKSLIEVIVATGRHPSQQRNAAAERAQGEFLIFLDGDSCAEPHLISRYEEALKKFEGASVVGGPSVSERQMRGFKLYADIVLSSPMGLGPFRARYRPLGTMRLTNERELILCNLLIRRDVFLANGGFRRDLYPNEENELLNRLEKKTKLVYHPEAICYREPRATFTDFARQFFWYGHGRAKHYVFLKPAWNVIFILPMIFAVSNFILVLQIFVQQRVSDFLIAPALLYLGLIIVEATRQAVTARRPGALAVLPMLFWTCHFFYGIGFLTGVISRPVLFFIPEKLENPEIGIHKL
jgi:succinoglycan biosynthesis protein ExoA